jgi:hypothetical protein
MMATKKKWAASITTIGILTMLTILIFGNYICCGTLDKKDLQMINIELMIAGADLDEIVMLVKDDPALEPILTEFRDVVGKVQKTLQAYLDTGISDTSNLVETIQAALTVSEPLIKEMITNNETMKRVQLGILVVRAVLRRVEAHLIGASKPEG